MSPENPEIANTPKNTERGTALSSLMPVAAEATVMELLMDGSDLSYAPARIAVDYVRARGLHRDSGLSSLRCRPERRASYSASHRFAHNADTVDWVRLCG